MLKVIGNCIGRVKQRCELKQIIENSMDPFKHCYWLWVNFYTTSVGFCLTEVFLTNIVRHYLVTQPRLQIKSKAAKLLINTYFEPWKGTRDYQHCNFFIRDADRQEIKSFLMQMKPPSQLYRAGKLPIQVLRETTVQSTTCYNSNCCHGKQRYD